MKLKVEQKVFIVFIINLIKVRNLDEGDKVFLRIPTWSKNTVITYGYAGDETEVKDVNDNAIVILRSKITYDDNSDNICEASSEEPTALVTGVGISKYEEALFNAQCEGVGTSIPGLSGDTYFQLVVDTTDGKKYKYNVNLEPNHPNYIYKRELFLSKPNGTDK